MVEIYKIMTTKEKAKRYDEALEKLREFYRDYDTVSCLIDVKEELVSIFPELKESKVEPKSYGQMEKCIYFQFNYTGYCNGTCILKNNEKKSAEWSEEDDENIMMIEDRFSDYLDYIREDSSLTKHRENTIKEEVIGYVNWLKSLKQRMEGK